MSLAEKIGPKQALMISVASVVIGLIVLLIAQPWTEMLGPSYSPARIGLGYAVAILILFIPAIICVLRFIQVPEWLAPPGKYSPEAKYEPFSAYTLIATAIAAAIYAVGGLPTGVNIDLPALITAFVAVYFGPLVSLIAWFIGFFIRWAIGGAPWLPAPLVGPLVAIIDSGVWAVNSYIYWYVMRSGRFKITGVNRYAYLVVLIIVMILIHLFGWLVIYAFTQNPWAAYVAYAAFALSTWYPTTIVFIIIGAIIGETAYESRAALAKVEAVE
ncbi:MAG: hypothetical protein J7L07_00720 [Candidatus Odinarchaeota archaeon]|nr:hypothetical protein [Candidatus Odinarchaeota archaeon]